MGRIAVLVKMAVGVFVKGTEVNVAVGACEIGTFVKVGVAVGGIAV